MIYIKNKKSTFLQKAAKRSDLLLVLRVELSEPGLHGETLPIEMCEVVLQGGNVRLETTKRQRVSVFVS